MRIKAPTILAAAAMAAVTSQPAVAGERSSTGMRVSVRIPPVCSLSSAPVIVLEGEQAAVSTFFESCNTNRGFQILAIHRPLEASELATVSYDQFESRLQPAGLSMIQFRHGARHGPVSVRVSADELTAPLAVSFAMTPV